jgi:hypothetical protein
VATGKIIVYGLKNFEFVSVSGHEILYYREKFPLF